MAHPVETVVDPISDPRSIAVPAARRDPPNFGESKTTKSSMGSFVLVAAILVICAGGYYYFWHNAPPTTKTDQLQTTEAYAVKR
jgi:hypothetical protein